MKTDIETIKRSQEEMNNIISELKNIVEGIEGGNMKRGMDSATWRTKQKKKLPERARKREKRLKKNEEGFKELQDNMK